MSQPIVRIVKKPTPEHGPELPPRKIVQSQGETEYQVKRKAHSARKAGGKFAPAEYLADHLLFADAVKIAGPRLCGAEWIGGVLDNEGANCAEHASRNAVREAQFKRVEARLWKLGLVETVHGHQWVPRAKLEAALAEYEGGRTPLDSGAKKPEDPARVVRLQHLRAAALRELRKNPGISERKLADRLAEKKAGGFRAHTVRSILQGKNVGARVVQGLTTKELRTEAARGD